MHAAPTAFPFTAPVIAPAYEDAVSSLPSGACPDGRAAAGFESVPGQGSRFEKTDKDPAARETVRAGGAAAGLGCVPGQGSRFEKTDKDPAARKTVRAGGAAAGLGVCPRPGACSDEPAQGGAE